MRYQLIADISELLNMTINNKKFQWKYTDDRVQTSVFFNYKMSHSAYQSQLFEKFRIK